ncbi:MAG: hypothetical protein ACR652_17645 [Methylocystis sp.]|uniref:hypothetical protein n=1 Tax=Methylocystis sp. TaxID=1911079 RepID=UPI003DA5FF4F
MSRWLRWYEGTCEDGKFRVVARKAGTHLSRVTNRDVTVTVRDVIALWAFMLEDAAHLDHRGTCERDEEFMAGVLDFDDGMVPAILHAMEAVDLIERSESGITLCNFDKRQFESDADPTATERQRRKRAKDRKTKERDKSVSNGRVTRDSRTPETETESEDKPPIAPPGGKGVKSIIPEGWTPPPVVELPPRAKACAEKWTEASYATEGEAFACYWRSERKMKADWRGTWANRVIARHEAVMRAQKFGNAPPEPKKAPLSEEEQRLQAPSTIAFYERIGKPDLADEVRRKWNIPIGKVAGEIVKDAERRTAAG